MKKFFGLIMLIVVASLFAGCSLIDKTETARLALKLTDAPAEGIDQVWVTVKSVEVTKNGGFGKQMLHDFGANPLKVDLLTLRFDEVLLGNADLPVGNYASIILNIDDTVGANYVVELGGTQENMKVPTSTLKIHHNFTIVEGEVRELVLDADVRDFITLRGNENKNNGYIINPTAIRVIDRKISANVTGVVLGLDTMPITGPNVIVDLYKADGTFLTGTLALSEDLKDDTGNVLKPAGSFILKGLLAGDYYVTIIAEGYTVYQSENFTVTTEEDLNLGQITLKQAQ